MRIAVIHTAFIGDLVLLSVLLDGLRQRWPRARLALLTTPAGADLYRDDPRLERHFACKVVGIGSARRTWSEEFIQQVRRETGITWVQLHGEEAPEAVAALLPNAYKAIGVSDESPLEEVRRYPGEHILLDARVPGAMPGGTGVSFDWTLATSVAAERKLTLAGGLTPDNVAECVRQIRPYRVDVASGVESAPGVKDRDKVAAFVRAVREA